jgi:hypothetical protein
MERLRKNQQFLKYWCKFGRNKFKTPSFIMARNKTEILERTKFLGYLLSIKYLNLHGEASKNFHYRF